VTRKNCAILVFLLCLFEVGAQTFDFNEENFFDEDLLEEESEEIKEDTQDQNNLQAFEQYPLEVTGYFESQLKYLSQHSTWRNQGDESLSPSLEYRLNFDSRPHERYRVFGSFELDYPFETSIESGETIPTGLTAREVFADVDWNDKAYLRTGKQQIKTGTGYFFNPIDILSEENIDLSDPEAYREGPMAARLQIPWGLYQFSLYVITENVEDVNDLSYTPRMDLLWGNWEFSLYGYYKEKKACRGMISFTGPVGRLKGLKAFGEGMAMNKSDKTFVDANGDTYKKASRPLFSGTIGLRYQNVRWSVADLLLIGQYFFNGEGYSHTDPFRGKQTELLCTSDLDADDLAYSGVHYTGTYIELKDLWDSGVTFKSTWIGNWTDQSGWISPSLLWSPIHAKTEGLKLEGGVRLYYGEKKSEYRSNGENRYELFLKITLGIGVF